MAVMGSGDITTRKPSVVSRNLTKRASAPGATRASEEHCGAMSQQRADSGAASTPQKFVRLVGCHDQKPRQGGGR